MTVGVIVPWRGGCDHRERALRFTLDRYADQHPEWTIVVADHDEGPWCKARAVTPSVEALAVDVVVVADADTACDGLAAAVARVDSGSRWAIPHRQVHRLTAAASEAFMSDIIIDELDEPAYLGHAGGGLVVLPRATYLDTPLDPRFEGWGQEDDSWALALTCLHGAPWRGTAPLFHLWHPPQPRLNRRAGSADSKALHGRYLAAGRDRRRMRALVEEVTGCQHDGCPQPTSTR